MIFLIFTACMLTFLAPVFIGVGFAGVAIEGRDENRKGVLAAMGVILFGIALLSGAITAWVVVFSQ